MAAQLHGSVEGSIATDVVERPTGRAPAGQDPAKRQQIIDGARRCFMELGFEAASMNDITAEAGVSKGTIYVYFANKEDLFGALIDRERGAMLMSAQQLLEEPASIRGALTAFGRRLTERLTSDYVIRAGRMVLGVTERMPDLARRFFGPDPFSAVSVLVNYLDRKIAAGEMVIDDTELAGRQFIELAMAGTFKRRLFGTLSEAEGNAQIDRMVKSAVDIFLAYYSPRR